jgi:hypothetical protein
MHTYAIVHENGRVIVGSLGRADPHDAGARHADRAVDVDVKLCMRDRNEGVPVIHVPQNLPHSPAQMVTTCTDREVFKA